MNECDLVEVIAVDVHAELEALPDVGPALARAVEDDVTRLATRV